MADFYAHLETCNQCATHPWQLCSVGDQLLRLAVEEQSANTTVVPFLRDLEKSQQVN